MEMLSILLMAGMSAMYQPQSNPTLLTNLQKITYEEPAKVSVKTAPNAYSLPEVSFVSQSFNNCGPAALSMVFSTYNKQVGQEELASQMRPFNNPAGGIDDKSVSPEEFVSTAKSYGFESIYRPNGNVNLLKQFVANGIPVVVRTWLNPNEDIGHYRIIKGYNDDEQMFIQDDSYQGPNLSYSYDEVAEMWQPFNYSYMLVYPKEKQAIVDAIIGEDIDEKKSYENALKRAQAELAANPNNPYAQLNRSTSLYHLGDYKNSVAAYDKARSGLPDRILWYQLEPLYAYQKEAKYDRVLEITNNILNSGNPAYSELYYVRGEVYLAEGDTQTAKSEFEKAIYYNTKFEPAQKALENI